MIGITNISSTPSAPIILTNFEEQIPTQQPMDEIINDNSSIEHPLINQLIECKKSVYFMIKDFFCETRTIRSVKVYRGHPAPQSVADIASETVTDTLGTPRTLPLSLSQIATHIYESIGKLKRLILSWLVNRYTILTKNPVH